jgi:hypothetical protein
MQHASERAAFTEDDGEFDGRLFSCPDEKNKMKTGRRR